MPTRCVDVFDGSGAKLLSYTVRLDESGCLDAEYEEMALILAECSGTVDAEALAHLQARCDRRFVETESTGAPTSKRSRRQKSTIVSLVKHKMKRGNAVTEQRRIRRAY